MAMGGCYRSQPLPPHVPASSASPLHPSPRPNARVHLLFGQVRVARAHVLVLQVLPTPVDVKPVGRL